MMSDAEIRAAIGEGLLGIEPMDERSLQPASYDMRVGAEAYLSDDAVRVDMADRGVVTIEPGDSAVVATRERVRCGAQVAAQIGLASPYARQGLVLLSGPQVDPGFDGVLVVRLANTASRPVPLAYESPFLTVQFFKLSRPVERPYSGERQGQRGISPRDIEDLRNPIGPTLGGIWTAVTGLTTEMAGVKADVALLQTDVAVLKSDVAVLKGDVAELKADFAGMKADFADMKVELTDMKIDLAEMKGEIKGEIKALKSSVRWIAWAVSAGMAAMTSAITVFGMLAAFRR
jgi:dCTP deaminase